ncbi:MAG: putative regulator [Rhodospirillaceae bacterium]|nr:MAG: putative regulator [Rhodospirillaceae bacterium]TNC98699.1 MAG: putative regulator PrlF [Stygiobacter sp.]
MWTEQIPIADDRLDVSATTSGGSPGMSLTVVRHGRMEGDARIAGQSEALLLLGTVAEAMNHMGWLSEAGRSLVASVVQAEAQRLDGADEEMIGAFLGFLDRDMAEHPERILPISASMVALAHELTKGVEVDLDEPLKDDSDCLNSK